MVYLYDQLAEFCSAIFYHFNPFILHNVFNYIRCSLSGTITKTIIINTGDKLSLQSTKGHKKGEIFNQLNIPNDSSGTQVIREGLMTHND